jgi:hypothetical protein
MASEIVHKYYTVNELRKRNVTNFTLRSFWAIRVDSVRYTIVIIYCTLRHAVDLPVELEVKNPTGQVEEKKRKKKNLASGQPIRRLWS